MTCLNLLCIAGLITLTMSAVTERAEREPLKLRVSCGRLEEAKNLKTRNGEARSGRSRRCGWKNV